MRKFVLSLMAMLSIDGCSKVDNLNYCDSSGGSCANNGDASYCNEKINACVLPLQIDSISPAIPGVDSKVATIMGKGFQDITSIKSNDTEVLKFSSTKSVFQIDMDIVGLRAAPEGASFFGTKCGPVPVTITRKDGLSTTANEMIGRSFSRWKYQNSITSTVPVIPGVSEFSFGDINRKSFDGIYYNNNRQIVSLLNSALKSDGVGPVGIMKPKILFINNGTDTQPKKAFSVQSKSSLATGFLGEIPVSIDLKNIAAGGKQLLDQYPINSGVTKTLLVSLFTGVLPIALAVKRFDFATGTVSMSASNYKIYESSLTVSFAPNDASCGVALTYPTDASMPSRIFPICENGLPEATAEIPGSAILAGTPESVASANARDGAPGTTRHYVLSRKGEALQMEVFDALRSQTAPMNAQVIPLLALPIAFDPKDIGESTGFGAKIEVYDLNCDNISDIVLKTDTRVIAYLGKNELSWESTPKVLFEMPNTAPVVTIKKAALWIPDYKTSSAVGVLGILDSTGNLSLYQQQ